MEQKKKLIPKKYLLTFILVTSLFALWGFANDITNPMVAAFQTVMELSAAKASLIQFAFYGGYATMAIPAALFIRRYSYKSGILLGLALYAVGAFLFIPAANYQQFSFFCISLYILTFGLAFLETTANPFILSLGDKETSTRRLNMAQAFNPVGSLCGMAVASFIVLPQLLSDKRDEAGQIIFPLLLAVIAITKMPMTQSEEEKAAGKTNSVATTLSNLWHNGIYREGVFAQMCYVAAQIMVWTFIIQYADHLGINKAKAQMFNICAMSLNLVGRFLGTYFMKWVNTRMLLTVFGVCASIFTLGAIWVMISLFMSIMFPSIYGIALEDVDAKDTHLGAAFLVMAIVGGALMPPLQGLLIDQKVIFGHPAVNVSFVLPLICFLIIICYGYRAYTKQKPIV